MKRFEPFGLDTSNECLWRNGVQIALPPKPFAVLRYLVENPGRLITHDELLDALWPETYVQPQVLRTYMLDLRKVLEDDAGQPRFIQTLPKRGYCFVAPVTEHACADRGHAPALPCQGIFDKRIVGRDEELANLNVQLESLSGGERRIVIVSGEPGIGKTALVDAFCIQVDVSRAANVAHGQCVEGVGGREQYYPVMEALNQLCASPGGEKACGILARMAPGWLALGRETAVPSDVRPVAHERLVSDLCGALEELAAEQPLILVFEDLHWADESTLNLLSALARRRAPAKLMVLATCWPRKGAKEHPLKGLRHDLLMRRLCVEVALKPLAKTAVRELLSRELEQDTVPSELASFVYLRSEGNPLFAIAVLEHLIAQRFLVRKGVNGTGQWELPSPISGSPEIESGVPDELAQMIDLEIERLSPEDQRLLEAGSLMDVAFPAWAVAAALEMDAAETEEACDALARRLYFVERAGQDELPGGASSAFYVFAHGIYREVLHRRQPAARRARRHIRIAERLGELFTGREASVARERAMHYEAAGEWHRAADALRAAAHHALTRRAYANAEELLHSALRVAENLSEIERDAVVLEIRGALIGMQDAAFERASPGALKA